jgi:repressor LexA
MSCREKIDNLLEVKALKLKSLDDLEARMAGGDEKTRVGDQTIRKAYNENRELTGRIQRRIISRFGLNPVWWETGNGDVFAEKGTRVPEAAEGAPGEIPFYDALAVGGMTLLADDSPVNSYVRMIQPGTFFKNAEGALQITGHSMFPKYPSGCVVAFKYSTRWKELIIWGEDYVIELSDRRILKRVEKSEVKGCIKAVSYNVNKENKYTYDPIDIPVEEIRRMYMVLGKIELEAMQL